MSTNPIDISAGLIPSPPPNPKIDLSSGLVPDSGQEQLIYSTGTPTNPVMGALKGLVDYDKGQDIGIAKGLGQTANTFGKLIRLGTGIPIPDESQYLQPEGTAQNIGAGLEGVVEFLLGDEALKGMSLADWLTESGKFAKALAAHPALAKLASVGMTALRQGAVGTAQGLDHGAPVAQALRQGEAAGVTGGAIRIGSEALSAAPLEDEAARLYARGLAPTGKADKAAARQVAPELSRRIPFAWTLQGLKDKAAAYLDRAGQHLRAVEDALPEDQTIDLNAVKQALRNFAGKFTVAADPNAAPVLIEHASPILDEHGLPIISVETKAVPTTVDDQSRFANAARGTANQLVDQLNQIDPRISNVIRQRRILDDGLRGVYNGADPAVNGGVLAQKTAADVLRGHIAGVSPDLASANREYSFWSKVNDVVDHTLQRRAGQSGGLMHLAGAGLGLEQVATGHPKRGLEILGGFEGARMLLQSPAGLTLTSGALNKLADAVGSGNIEGAARLLVQEAGPGAAATFMRGVNQAANPQEHNNVATLGNWDLRQQHPVGSRVSYQGSLGTVVGHHPKSGKAVVRWDR